jgi:lipopolysaccharide transport system permease protein
MEAYPLTVFGEERYIKATGVRSSVDWREIWAFRDLLILLVRRDFSAKYKQTVLGPLWFVFQPLLMTLVFTLVFGKVANLSTDGLPGPLFYMSGLLCWNYFSATFASVSGTFAGNMHIFSKVYFPRLVVPLASVVSNLLTFFVQLTTFAAFFVYFKCFTDAGSDFWISRYLALLPLLILQTMALALGVGLCLAAATAKYRDLIQVLGIVSQVWLYATPVIYPTSKVPERFHWLMALNPVTGIVEGFRFLLLGTATLSWQIFLSSVILTIGVLGLGLSAFRHVERTVVDFA